MARGELAPAATRHLILLGKTLDAARAEAPSVFDEPVSADRLLERAFARARRDAELPPQAFATTKCQLRATALGRIAEARSGRDEPRLAVWLGEEMRRAAAAVLRRAA